MSRTKLYHSICFGDGTLVDGKFTGLETYRDWHLIPTSRPTISMPGVEAKFVTIPGMDGTLDLSQFIRRDRPAYGNRSGTFEFDVENTYDESGQNEYWMTIYPKIVNALHGKKFKMVLMEDDPDYFWEGRFTVDKYEPGDGHHSTVAISYQVGPFKWKIRTGNSDIVWDNFNFQRDYDNGEESGYVYGNGGIVRVDVTGAGAGSSVTIGSEVIDISNRSTAHIVRTIEGKKLISKTGPGTMVWREGSL